jgi:isocitrate lyase
VTDSRLEGTLNGSTHANGQASAHPLASKIESQAAALHREWATDPRWAGIERTYSATDVVKLRGSVQEEHTLARLGAERLWSLLQEDGYVNALGALTGNQAVQQVKAGLRAIYLSGWQVAADANLAGQTYPDQSLYPANSVPAVVRRINNALLRADQITWAESQNESAPYWLAPIVADAEAGFGGVLNAFELMKAMIAAGAAGVHWEDQLASEKKCGHLGGKVLIPTGQHIKTLNAARLAADVCGAPSLVVARTDAQAATLITSDVDERDQRFVTGERTAEGFYRVRNGLESCIARGLAYAPYAELLWMETSTPNLEIARKFAEAIRDIYPDQMLAYNCSPSFNWRAHLDSDTIAKFQRELGAMGYKFQFVTLAGFHALNHSMFELARGYRENGMTAYAELQEREFASEEDGFTAVQHQQEVGAGYFEEVAIAITGGESETTALSGSTEESQFQS